MGDDGIYIARVMNEKLYMWRPSVSDVETLAANRGKYWAGQGYFGTLYRLLLAGFCLVFMCSPSAGDDIFKPTGRFAVIRNSRITQWYLVSEPWCINCPPAKVRFLAKGWPEANIITAAEAHERFGILVRSVPYEFPEPESQPVKAAAVESKPVAIESGPVRHVYYQPRTSRRFLFWRR